MQRKMPVRQCVACRAHREKNGLIRVVRSPEGAISLDPTGKKPGRGAYLCRHPDCLKRAQKIRALQRAFAAPLSEEIFEMLACQMEGLHPDGQGDGGQRLG